MPHTKRKGVIRVVLLPALASTPLQQTVDRFFSVLPTTVQSSGGLDSLALDVGLGEPIVLSGLETSLSPPSTLNPPCPAAAGALEQEKHDPGSGYTGSPSEGTVSVAEQLISAIKRAGIEPSPMEAPLNNIRLLLQRMEIKITKSTEEVSNNTTKLDILTKNVDLMKMEFTVQARQTQEEIQHFQQFKAATIKDNTLLHRKLEQIENFNHWLNLRFLNFPHAPNVLPIDFLKRNLKIPLNNIPPVNKIYYLPNRKASQKDKKNDQETQTDFENVTVLLEQTLTADIERATLWVSFIFEQYVNMVLKLYFKNSQKLFGGQKIWSYHDVSETTQEQRKYFLSLCQETINLGASFLLAYPCKCLVRYLTVKYTFFFSRSLEAVPRCQEDR